MDAPKPVESELPPPLPPMGGTNPPPMGVGSAPSAAPVGGPSLSALKPGVGKTFCSVVNALPYWLEKVAPGYQFAVEPVTSDEGELWAEFALPVIDKWMPKFKESPEYALATITVVMLAGKIRVTKKVVAHGNAGSETDR